MATKEDIVAPVEYKVVEFKDTRIGRTVRTFAQVFIAMVPVFLGIVLIPEVQTFIAANVAWLVPLLPPTIAVVTFLYNYIQDKLKAATKTQL